MVSLQEFLNPRPQEPRSIPERKVIEQHLSRDVLIALIQDLHPDERVVIRGSLGVGATLEVIGRDHIIMQDPGE